MKDSANAKGWKEVTACRGCKQANQVNDSDVNNSAHAKSHASKKPLLVGYIKFVHGFLKIFKDVAIINCSKVSVTFTFPGAKTTTNSSLKTYYNN